MARLALAALLLALAASPMADADTLYKCVGRDGKVVYQDEKCRDEQRQSTVAPPTPPSRAPQPAEPAEAAPAGDGPPIDLEGLVSVISNVENCMATVSGFGARHGGAYQRWKDRNKLALVRYNQDGAAQRRVRESREYVTQVARSESAEERAYRAENCDKAVAASINPPAAKTQ